MDGADVVSKIIGLVLSAIASELKAVRTQYITKDEFVTQIAKLTAQNDRIYDMLFDLARKGGA